MVITLSIASICILASMISCSRLSFTLQNKSIEQVPEGKYRFADISVWPYGSLISKPIIHKTTAELCDLIDTTKAYIIDEIHPCSLENIMFDSIDPIFVLVRSSISHTYESTYTSAIRSLNICMISVDDALYIYAVQAGVNSVAVDLTIVG